MWNKDVNYREKHQMLSLLPVPHPPYLSLSSGTRDLYCGMWNLLVVACRILSCGMRTL